MKASTTCEENHDIYRELVAIEILSSFSFQSSKWLGDIAPHLLSEEMQANLEETKQRAKRRAEAEALLPKTLLFTRGRPTQVPTFSEAVLLAEVRLKVAEAVGIQVGYTQPDTIRARYTELLEQQAKQDRTCEGTK